MGRFATVRSAADLLEHLTDTRRPAGANGSDRSAMARGIRRTGHKVGGDLQEVIGRAVEATE